MKPDEIKLIAYTVPVEIQLAEPAGEGPAKPRRFKLRAYTGEAVRTWFGPVVVDVASMDTTQQMIPALCDHNPEVQSIVGQVESVTVTGSVVDAEGIFTPTDEPGDLSRMVLAKADAGYQWQASISGPSKSMEDIQAGATVNVNGRDFTGPITVIRGLTLREISFTVLGADRHTSALVFNEPNTGVIKMNETTLSEVPAVEVAVTPETEEVETETPAATPAAVEPAPVSTPTLSAPRQPRPTSPNIIIRNNQTSLQALQGALLLSAGGKLDCKAYNSMAGIAMLGNGGKASWLNASINDDHRNRIMEEAHKLSNTTATEFCRLALIANGKDVPHDKSEMIRFAFSSGSLTNSTTTSMCALLLASYMETDDSTNGWTAESDVPNLLLNERVRTLTGTTLSKQPANTQADHVSIADVAESYRIARYSGQFMVDEITIINDSLGGVFDEPKQMGAAARRLKADLVYGIMLANPTLNATSRALFNATDANLITGSALTKATLITALARMGVIREGGINLNIRPTHLITPRALADVAYREIMSALDTNGATAASGSTNPIQRYGLSLVTDARMDNGLTHPDTLVAYSGSTTSWFVASADNPAIEIGYLKGTGRAPKMTTKVVDGENGEFGLHWTVRHFIGGLARDWKSIEKMTA